MNEFDKARREVLAALLMEYHRTEGALVDSADLRDIYPLKTRDSWFDPIISEVEHLLIVSRTYDGVAARVHPRGYGAIFRETLENLDASMLEIDPKKEEVLSDGTNYEWFPLPDGWKWLQVSADGDPTGATVLHDSVEAQLLPASDRLVPLDHNSAPYQDVRQGLVQLFEEVRSANDLDCTPEERDRVLVSLSAAQKLWDAAQLKIVQIQIGIIITVQDAVALLTKAGRAVGKALLIDTIKSIVKHKTGIEL